MAETEERIVTIFGGSKCRESDPEYTLAKRVGELLAEAGYTICTGGYLCAMEAGRRGGHEGGGRVVGIGMNQVTAEPNRFLTGKGGAHHFYSRPQPLIKRPVGCTS